MRHVLSFLLAFLLAGCATQAPEKQVVYVPQRVEVPVQVPCTVKGVSRPKFALDDPAVLKLTDAEKAFRALAELEEREAYIIALETENQKCRGPDATSR